MRTRGGCGRTDRRFVQLKVTANRSAVRVGVGAARPTRDTWGWGLWWGRRKIRSGAATTTAAGHVGARVGVAPSTTGSRKLRAALPPWHRRAQSSAGTIDGGHHEVPLVVAGLTFVDADRCFLALAVNPHDAAAHGSGRGIGEAVLGHPRQVREPARRLRGATTARRRGARRPSTSLAGLGALTTAGPDSGGRSGPLTLNLGL